MVDRQSVRLSVAVQHHPARPECLERVVGDLGREIDTHVAITDGDLAIDGIDGIVDDTFVGIEIVEDPEPWTGISSPWRCAKECWRLTPEWCTHRLVVQDDALVCRRFLWAAVEAIRHRPDQPISFYQGWRPHSDAVTMLDESRRSSWHLLPRVGWVPCVALAMPHDLAVELGAWEAGRDHPIADDEQVFQWLEHRRHAGLSADVWQTIPSLVQHDDRAPSTIGGHNGGMLRYAACFIGNHDPGLVDWTRGLDGGCVV